MKSDNSRDTEPSHTQGTPKAPGAILAPMEAAGGVPRPKKARLSTRIHKRRREPGEVVTRSAAIQNHCRECMGFDSDGQGSLATAVRACTATACWLYPWRNGALDTEEE